MPNPILWEPTARRREAARLTIFRQWLAGRGLVDAQDTQALYRWSIDQREQFWPAVAAFCGMVGDGLAPSHGDVVIGGDRMAPPDPVLGPRWFPHARLNYAENLLRAPDHQVVIIAVDEQGARRSLTASELRAAVGAAADGLRALSVGVGDRVAAFMPNVPETVIGMLAAASIGAIWSSCSPDFGPRAVLDRFGQIAPKVLLCADGVRYAGVDIDCLDRVRQLVADLPTLQHVVIVPLRGGSGAANGIRGAISWSELTTHARAPTFVRLPFDHPLFIMYSSGTTGLPKCMVHGAGGTLLQHQKEHVLHTDLDATSRLCYVTTCGWMMWNWMASALATGASLVLYDGAPFATPDVLWDVVAREQVTAFGTSARYLALCEKEGLAPRSSHDLSGLQTIISTGSPLAPHSYDYVYDRVAPDVHLANVSGGTEIISCWVLGDPTAPVRRGEIQTRGLGMAAEVWDRSGSAIVDEPGELVCTRPFPSMPVAFWNDPDANRYRSSYFAHFPGVWRHGDWCELTTNGGAIIYGRSDATLNPGGVRIGTAELYRQVELVPEVLESIAVAQSVEGALGDVRIVLFVRLRSGLELDDALRHRIRTTIRHGASPRHVPALIIQLADLPRTVSGKLSELAIRERIHGRPVPNTDALANPESLDELWSARVRAELAAGASA